LDDIRVYHLRDTIKKISFFLILESSFLDVQDNRRETLFYRYESHLVKNYTCFVEIPNSHRISSLDSSLGRSSACGAGGGGSGPARDMFFSVLS
jgi:hypothetical protein